MVFDIPIRSPGPGEGMFHVLPDGKVVLCHTRRKNLSYCSSDMFGPAGLGFGPSIVRHVKTSTDHNSFLSVSSQFLHLFRKLQSSSTNLYVF